MKDVPLTRELHRSGNSTVLTIPPDILEKAGIEKGDQIAFSVTEDGEIRLNTKRDTNNELQAGAD